MHWPTVTSGGSDSACAVEGFADDVGVAGVACRFLNHVEQDVANVALNDVWARAGIVKVHRRGDSAGLLDLLEVVPDLVVDGVVLIYDQVSVSGDGPDRRPLVEELASAHDDLKPTAFPGCGMLDQTEQ